MTSNLPAIVDIRDVNGRLNEFVLADVRWYLDGRTGANEYLQGHIPGAVFVDLDTVLAGSPSPSAGRHPLPDPEQFAAALAALGIGDQDTVIAYDDAGGVIAARLVWMLRAIGHRAALLDGGLTSWRGPFERAPAARPAATFTPAPWPTDRLASPDDAADERTVTLDARERQRFSGESEPVDPRAGHIPGARSFPCRENLDADGRLLPEHQLRDRLESLGVQRDSEVVSYCGSGVTACHNLLVLEQLGYTRARLYPGSWSQWSSDPACEVATGD